MEEIGQVTTRARPEGFTVEEYMAESTLKKSQANNVLRQLCDAGKLTRELWQGGKGGRSYIYNYIDG